MHVLGRELRAPLKHRAVTCSPRARSFSKLPPSLLRDDGEVRSQVVHVKDSEHVVSM